MVIHTTTFVILVVEHGLEGEIAQWVHHERTIRLLVNVRSRPINKKHTNSIISKGIVVYNFLWFMSVYKLYRKLIPMKEGHFFYLTKHIKHFIYSYIASDIW